MLKWPYVSDPKAKEKALAIKPTLTTKLFDPEPVAIEKPRKLARRHLVDSVGVPLVLRKGEINRPDKSEMKNNLSFNWDR